MTPSFFDENSLSQVVNGHLTLGGKDGIEFEEFEKLGAVVGEVVEDMVKLGEDGDKEDDEEEDDDAGIFTGGG